MLEDLEDRTRGADKPSLFLAENADWQKKYAPGSLRAKRLAVFEAMKGFATL